MDFNLTDEQQMFVDLFRDFAQNEVAPHAEQVDRQESTPVQTLRKAAELDLLGIPFPEQYGGMNAGLLSYGLLMEELGKACLSTAVSIGAHCAVAMMMATGGTEAQKKRWLPVLIKGQAIGASAISEPDAGSDASAIVTHARPDGDGYLVNGRKSWVINGDQADMILVLARIEQGTGIIVVENDTPGLLCGWRNKQMGLRGAAGVTIFLDECHVPSANLLGDNLNGLDIVRRVSSFARLGTAFACLGIAERGLADSLEFAKNRQQFGGPIAMKQAIQGYLGDMATQIATLRHLAYHTAWLMEQGTAGEGNIAMLKLWAGQVATWVINKAVQIHGGMGYIKSFHIERLYRDVRAMSILDGTTEMQRLAVASDLLKGVGIQTVP